MAAELGLSTHVTIVRTDLTDAQFHALWGRLRDGQPSLEHFAPSPQMAATALELGIGPALGGGWVEIRRLGGVTGDAWAVRAGGLDAEAVRRLRAQLAGRRVGVEPTPEVVALRARRHRINMRLALTLALVALGGVLALQPLIVFPT